LVGDFKLYQTPYAREHREPPGYDNPADMTPYRPPPAASSLNSEPNANAAPIANGSKKRKFASLSETSSQTPPANRRKIKPIHRMFGNICVRQ
jgi:hypothetical protein